jgi:hypothetical protein
MNQKVLRGAFFICALLLFCIGCSAAPSGGGPTTYNGIIIDTYDPVNGSDPAGSANYIELWNSDCTALLASDDGANEIGRSSNQYYAYIDYTGVLTSGDYWVLIHAHSDGDTFGYAIRVLTAPNASYTGWTFGAFLPSEPSSDAPTAGMMGVPTKYQTISLTNTTSDKLNRFILPSGVNWVKVHLP